MREAGCYLMTVYVYAWGYKIMLFIARSYQRLLSPAVATLELSIVTTKKREKMEPRRNEKTSSKVQVLLFRLARDIQSSNDLDTHPYDVRR